ncbi:hypothetical protein J3E06_001511 [Methanococcus voltae]|uniref:Uncharacterized protein n=1 Tax=Methanococcus voltae (strain ATCC BAA-1334 / A3) TaxID=456320 RepID=D7DSU1_METV3|nr:hypothetical protein [Methanococcus voltae]
MNEVNKMIWDEVNKNEALKDEGIFLDMNRINLFILIVILNYILKNNNKVPPRTF